MEIDLGLPGDSLQKRGEIPSSHPTSSAKLPPATLHRGTLAADRSEAGELDAGATCRRRSRRSRLLAGSWVVSVTVGATVVSWVMQLTTEGRAIYLAGVVFGGVMVFSPVGLARSTFFLWVWLRPFG